MKALLLVEHVDRELDVACLARMLLKRDFDVDLQIANASADAPAVLSGTPPKIVFYHSFYTSKWPLTDDYVSAWPGTQFVSLAWEQIFNPFDRVGHRPMDSFARDKVIYLAWSDTYRDFLIGNGVKPENIRTVGHALYRLYGEPYSRYFKSRDALAKRFSLNPSKRWVFIPENFAYFFILTDTIIKNFKLDGVPEEVSIEIREYCRKGMYCLGKWADALARREEVEVIVRPRPSLDRAMMAEFIRDECGISEPRFRLVKEETARDWVLASDVVMSSYSTILIEAALVGKTIRKFEPIPIPPALKYEWLDLVCSVGSEEEVINGASVGASDGGSNRLRTWALSEFFANSDPVLGLVRAIAAETMAAHKNQVSLPKGQFKQRMPIWLGILDRFVRLSPVVRDQLYRKFVPSYTHRPIDHEKDFFDWHEVELRTKKWKDVLSESSFVGSMN
jgi:surface carbohydrate biosynthesis protein